MRPAIRPARSRVAVLVLSVAFLAASCASPNRLAKQSEVALGKGDVARAYEKARKALDKETTNLRARAAFTAAASALDDQHREKVLDLAASGDTVAAAFAALERSAFLAEVERYDTNLPVDPDYQRQDVRIRRRGAAALYRDGEGALKERRPKDAYAHFRDAGRLVPGYRDVAKRQDEAYALAVSRVAVLPFANETALPGLTREIGDRFYARLIERIHPEALPFTRLVPRQEIDATMTVAQLDRLTEAEALRLGRSLAADRIVYGRVYGLDTHTDSDRYRQTIFRKVTTRGEDGSNSVHFQDSDFEAVWRHRRISVRVEFQVLDVGSHRELARHEDVAEASAHVVFTDYQPEGDCADYCLTPPDLEKSKPDHAKERHAAWKERFGEWTLPAFLTLAKDRRTSRLRYQPRFRDEFASPGTRPVFLAELPPESDLAALALADAWRPVYATLEELDRE